VTRRRASWAVALASLLVVRAVSGQRPDSTFAAAVQAYDNLDFHNASAAFRRVAATAPRGRAPGDLEPTLAYLGASEWFEGLRDSAVSTFRALVILDPRYRPSDIVFPPEITGAFADVRRLTKVVDIGSSLDTTIQTRDGRFSARLFASSPHPVTVAVLREDGTTLRALYAGPIGDSLDVRWDGLDSSGTVVATGTYVLSATSRGPDGHAIRTARAALEVTVITPTLLPAPPPVADSLLLPEHLALQGSWTSLVAGLVDGALVATLPSLVEGSHPSGGRFVIAAGVGIAGLAGFVAHRGSRPIPENVAANQRLRQAWQHRVDAVTQLNAARRREPALVIRVGPRVVIEQESF
jgi:hypothetical protein